MVTCFFIAFYQMKWHIKMLRMTEYEGGIQCKKAENIQTMIIQNIYLIHRILLQAKKLIHRIVELSNINRNDTVVEIDRRMYERAGARLSKYSNLQLICGDFLKYRLPVKGSYKIYANIPYFITTQIIGKLTSGTNMPTDIWLIMEKGAAKRFMGIPRETEKSLLLKVNWEMKIRYHFRRFIEHSMKYGICGKNGLLTKRQVAVALKQAGLPHAHEDGLTLYVQWLCLFRCYQKFGR